MNVRRIVGQGLQMTNEHFKKLIWYAFIPAFLGVVISSAYLTYQYYTLINSPLFSTEQRDIWAIYDLFKDIFADRLVILVTLVILAILVVLGNILLKPIFNGTLINALMRLERGHSIDGSVEVGIRKFFPLFEFGILTSAFSITALFTQSFFILKLWGQNALFFILPILLFVAMAGLMINFFFVYSEYYIVLEDKKLIKSLVESFYLVIGNLRKTILVLLLMILIGARAILNALFFLLIPMLVIFLTSYFETFFLSMIGIVLMAVIILVVLVASAYLLGFFQIFATAVWVLTFKQLRLKSLGIEHDEE